MSDASAWATQRERGSLGVLWLMARIGLTLGWRVANALLYPITLFYMTTAARPQRDGVRRYLARGLGRSVRWRDQFRLYFAFASTMLDRVFLLTGRSRGYEITIEGLDLLKAEVAGGRGVILLGAHVGSFDALRALAGAGAPVEIRTLMHEDNAAKANGLYNALDPGRHAAVIPLGRPESMLAAKECLDRGGIVAILADRATRGDRMFPIPFLGAPAPLPAGPLQLAAVLGAPVYTCAGLWLGPRRYLLRFEPFVERIVLDRARRDAATAEWLARYAAWLEGICREYPYNWFNFFDFWQEQDTAP